MANNLLTPQQFRAATTVGRDLLVSASAGTGKTTVLAQRFIHLVRHEGMSLRQILAVTFTDAAAADMRRKIGEGLRECVKEQPDNDVLKRELLLIDRAPISTLHSFCLKVLREHFHLLDLDPGFSILDPDEAELLKSEVAERLLEECFERQDEPGAQFLALVEASGGQGGSRLVEAILRLHEFLQTLPSPDEWRQEVRLAYRAEEGFATLHWKPALEAARRRELDFCSFLTENTLQVIDRLPGAHPYRGYVENMRNRLAGWRAAFQGPLTESQWREWLTEVSDNDWGRMPAIRSQMDDEKEASGRIQDLKKKTKARLGDRFARFDPERIVADVRSVGACIDWLLVLQEQFADEYHFAKDERAVLDFNDLERNCHSLLKGFPAVVQELRQRFNHVLVDEYQDINPLQDAILQSISEPSVNQLFMVGDEKQSIYGFRLAAPWIFREKYRSFSPDLSAAQARIPLTFNFRSRKGILYAVNHIFKRIVVPALGNDYGEDAKLEYGAGFAPHPDIADVLPVEVHLLQKNLDTAEAENEEGVESSSDTTGDDSLAEKIDLARETYVIAKRILEHVGKTPIRDGKDYRPARFGDIVILLRTTNRRADEMADVLRGMNVPVYADLTTGFFDAVEVRDLISLLEVLDNAQQDVPLAAVLRSPVVGLNEDQLAAIRVHSAEVRFHHAVRQYADNGPDQRLRRRLSEFLARVRKWREQAAQLPLARVLWEIYRETHYLAYVQGLPGGAARRANLVQLHDRARQFDQFSRRGLFRFLRFLRRLQEAEQDLGPAPVLSESDDVVRIMSIHKSKGLEFPIVVVPDLAKQFNFSDQRDQFLLHRDLLIGVDRVDLEQMARATTLPKLLIAEEKRIELLAEEQRLLYVALTRARERLILCGTTEVEDRQKTWRPLPALGRDARILDARRMLDWIGPVLAGHADTANELTGKAAPDPLDESRFELHRYTAQEIGKWRLTGEARVESGVNRADLAALRPIAASVDAAIRQQAEAVVQRLQWNYPAPQLCKLSGKESVTGLRRRFQAALEDDQPGRESFRLQITRRPDSLSEGNGAVGPAERGTATHTVLQHLDFNRPLDQPDIKSQITNLIEKRLLGEREAGAVDIGSIERFFARPLGQRLRRSTRARRELPFSLLVPVVELEMSSSGKSVPADVQDTVLVQGIMDCLFWDEVGIVLLDYKTDDVPAEQLAQVAEKYRSQIDLYRRAIRSIFALDVNEAHLAFLTPGVDVSIQ